MSPSCELELSYSSLVLLFQNDSDDPQVRVVSVGIVGRSSTFGR